ncbi:hypothetical protein VP1G_00098 [Cytospora mali]|uniref:Apple domain-containing protein n=1 Tax=Cytospora mali TaxID=578113 RepID=A0A194ULX3_CYTMA|nr:hypothetical protein VP1G_00098 [Valsa mali var. pyri (nom. inval.)]
MQSTMMILSTLLAAGALASPVAQGRPQMCNTPPNGPPSANFAPISQPIVTSADFCLKHCQDEPNCFSFIFGLPSSVETPICLLFGVPGSQVPSRSGDFHVFDKACAGVPTGRPSRQDPFGEHGSFEGHRPSNGDHRPSNGDHGSSNGSKGPSNSDHASDNGAKPTPSHTPSPNQSPPQGGHQQRDTANRCGGPPSGPAGNQPAPMHTHADVPSEKACLILCKKADGCKAVEFGKPSADAAQECRLFNVGAGSLPAPGDGQSFTAFDSGC